MMDFSENPKRQANEFPFSVRVGLWSDRFGEFPFCGGTLISPSLVLTAAHCVSSHFGCEQHPIGVEFTVSAARGSRLQAIVGAHDYTRPDGSERWYTVRRIIVHPSVNQSASVEGNDIAILKLDVNIVPNAAIQPICFPSKRVILLQGQMCFFAGWGKMYKVWSMGNLVFPKTLREAEVQIEFDGHCMQYLYPYYPDRHTCLRTPGTSPCAGDSGGGLFCPSVEGSWFWYGAIHGGSADCLQDAAMVVNVMTIHEWIKTSAFRLGL
ncbi:Chymotrypsin-like elastase member 3A [Sparganum proliferum]